MEEEKRGRPSIYTDEIADEICRRLALGESLRSVCRSEHLPQESTVRQWATEDYKGFYAQYAKAREIGYLCMADELLDIADDATEDPSRSRLRVDTRKWLLSKALPKVYGDTLLLGQSDVAPPTTVILNQSPAKGEVKVTSGTDS